VWLLPVSKAESALKETHFQPVDEVKSKMADLLNGMSATWKMYMQ
jgi:hypothetical protein